MGGMVGQWRATYSPGDWLVLGGPTSLVLLEPPGDDLSALLDQLWEHVVSSESMPDLATRLAAFKIDAMPTFAAFFWTEHGMRSLIRGDVSLVDVATGDVVATGEGIQTWTEIGLADLTQVRLERHNLRRARSGCHWSSERYARPRFSSMPPKARASVRRKASSSADRIRATGGRRGGPEVVTRRPSTDWPPN